MNGAILLDDDGKRKLDDDGKLMLDDDAGNACSCGCAVACPTDCSAIGSLTLAMSLTNKFAGVCCNSITAQTLTRTGCSWSYSIPPGVCGPTGAVLGCSIVSGVERWTLSGTGCYGGFSAYFEPSTPGDPRGTYTVTASTILCNVISVVIS